jgi:hypothetical protein
MSCRVLSAALGWLLFNCVFGWIVNTDAGALHHCPEKIESLPPSYFVRNTARPETKLARSSLDERTAAGAISEGHQEDLPDPPEGNHEKYYASTTATI